jgi:hypothetical protein
LQPQREISVKGAEEEMRVTKSARLLLVVLGIGLLLCDTDKIRAQNSEPVYQGKPESYWINSLRFPVKIDQASRFSLLGSNEVPVLLKAVEMQVGTNAAAIRTNAAFLLSLKGDPQILLPLARKSKDAQVRATALGGLNLGREELVSAAMFDALRDKAAIVRRVAVMKLGKTQGQRTHIPELFSALLKCLNDEDPDVCYLAASGLCQFDVNFPHQDRATIAQTAFSEIKVATSHPDAVVKKAAQKAVNGNETHSALVKFTHELAISLAELHGQTWTASVQVMDEGGLPIEGADVSATYYIPAAEQGGDRFSSWQKIEGKTTTNGLFIASHRDSSGRLNFTTQKAGYQAARSEHEKPGIYPGNDWVIFHFPGVGYYQQTTSNLNLSVTLTLKKK